MDGMKRQWWHTFLFVCALIVAVLPWLGRLGRPNIIGDDIQRIVDLQTLTLPQRLARPFNEHLAPLFELFSALTWDASGRTLAGVPLSFTLASLAPYAITLALLFLLMRREWGSRLAAGLALIVFASTPVYAECVWWFSASTFTWALALSLGSLILASAASEKSSLPAAIGACLACFLAPMGSAIGLLAGPAAALRAWPTQDRDRPIRWSLTLAALPMVGTILNLGLSSLMRYHEVVAQSVSGSNDILGGLARSLQAPLYVVLTSFGGVLRADRMTSLAGGLAFLIPAAIWFAWTLRRSSPLQRRWLWIGALWVASGYVLIYGFRTHLVGPERLVTVQRYHLFPFTGLVFILTAASAPHLRRWAAQPGSGSLVLLTLALVLMFISRPVMRDRLNYYRTQSDQRATMGMLDRLADASAKLGFTREQVIAALPPIEPRWGIEGENILKMLPVTIDRGTPMDPSAVRAAVVAALPAEDRVWLLSDMDATGLLLSRGDAPPAGAPRETARLVRNSGMEALQGDRYRSRGWPSHLEFAFGPDRPQGPARTLILPGLAAAGPMELWWAAEGEDWSDDRRVLIRPGAAGVAERALPLDRLPAPAGRPPARIRVSPRAAGEVAIGAPQIIR